ncbi:MAG: arginine--tRNA ligase domain-containing protein, partial [Candidatus Heimdallarchaeaceae archaeon]
MKKRTFEELKSQLEKTIKEIYDLEVDLIWSIPPSQDLGDLSFPLFNVAKQLSIKPEKFGEKIRQDFSLPEYVDEIKLQGGFLNVFLNKNEFSRDTLLMILENPKYGQSNVKSKERIIVEHTSSNPTSPLHVGHLRNSILGDVLGRLFRFLGAAINFRYYVNDLGRQIASVIIGYFLLKEKGIESDSKVDLWIGKIYASMNTLLEIHQLNEQLTDSGIINKDPKKQYKITTEEAKKYKKALLNEDIEEKHKIINNLERHLRIQNSLEKRIPNVFVELRNLVTEKIENLNQLTIEYIIKYQEGKDKEIVTKFREVTEAALSGHVGTLKLFNIFLDDFDWESDVAWSGEVDKILEELEKRNHLIHDGKARLLNNDNIGSTL